MLPDRVYNRPSQRSIPSRSRHSCYAGGTGGLGRAIVEAIVANGKDKVVVLSRNASTTSSEAPIVAVNYEDIPSLTSVLEKHGIETVITTINIFASNQQEINLIRAAAACKTTKRFIPSSFGLPYSEKEVAVFLAAKLKLECWDELKKSGLEYSRVNNGCFLDYWGTPKVKTYLSPVTQVLDLPNSFAALPRSEETPVAFTHTFDVARFVAAYLRYEQWKPEAYVIGDKVNWNEFVRLAEEAKGVKFRIVHDPKELLETGAITELPSHIATYQFFPKKDLQALFAEFGLWFEDGTFDLKPTAEDDNLNTIFPQVKPIGVKTMLEKGLKD